MGTCGLSTLGQMGWDHMGGGGWWIVMMLGMVLFWGAIIFLVVWAVRGGLGERQSGGPRALTALEMLERRLAEGEITVEEYRQRREALRESPG